MELSGPCFVIVKNGRLINKYELIARVRTPKGIQSTMYYFDTPEDAEIYREYLIQKEGAKELDRVIHSERTYLKDKKEYEEFRDSIDWATLPTKVKKIKVEVLTDFVEMRGIK